VVISSPISSARINVTLVCSFIVLHDTKYYKFKQYNDNDVVIVPKKKLDKHVLDVRLSFH